MTEQEAINILQLNTPFVASKETNKAVDMAINALEVKSKITEIVNRQLIAEKNNYKEIYDCFYEIVKVVQDNY